MKNTAELTASAMGEFVLRRHEIPPERIEETAADAREARARKVLELRDRWGGPARCWDVAARSEGEWGDKFDKIRAMLGSGFLVALVGTNQTGKTTMAHQLMLDATKAVKSARYVTAMRFFTEIKAGFGGGVTEAEIVEKYRKPSFLVIDEFGKRGENDWQQNLLFMLLDERYSSGKKDTLLIDNRDVAAFGELVGPSLVSRLNRTGGVVACNWPAFD